MSTHPESEDNEPTRTLASCALTIDDLILDRALEGEDRDEFQRTEIAARIAELACSAELPLNIGLFGPWGSGKSSMFLLIEQAIASASAARPAGGRATDVALIRYDAWKYGGHSLRRNFISNAASALGIGSDDPQGYRFHRGLYEQRRSAEIQAGRFFAASLRAAFSFTWLFLLFVLLSAAVVGVTSWLTGKEVGEVSPRLLAGGGIVTLILALVRAIFETGTVQVEQTRPSDDEEFSAAFRALIRRATARLPDRGVSRHLIAYRHWRLDPQRDLFAKLRRWWIGIGKDEQTRRWQTAYPGYRRLIFFIDELDRCAEVDVVKTLNALRTFLDEHDCAFIVAADRAVLELALEGEAQQVTPINPEAPYYSEAGAFLDKIFQYQIDLPPLRRRRLTAFARERVNRLETGVWSELRTAGLVDRVLPALIPTQVHSPRRVKILLNNFATSARIAQSRAVQWPQRAPEIAKLVALQTEFPHFAHALASEPRLVRLLLSERDELPENDSVRALWDRFRAAGAEEVFLAREAHESSPVSRHSDRRAAWDQMTKRQAQNLLNFLRATDDINGPQSDLIYLEPAGASFGLEDPVLGDRIERDAADVPEDVALEIAEREPQEQGKAVQLLASIMPDAVGRQRTNELAVLLETAEHLVEHDELGRDAALAAARTLHLYLAESQLNEEQLLGALRIAIVARDEPLIAKVFADDRLMTAGERVQAVAELYGRLPGQLRAGVARSVAEQLAQTPSVLVEPMQTLPEKDAVQLYSSDQIRQAVQLSVQATDEHSTALVMGLVQGALPIDGVRYPEQLRAVLDHLIELHSEVVYSAFHHHLTDIREGVDDDARFNRYVLTLWSQDSGADWESWCEALVESTQSDRVLVPAVLATLFEGYADAPADEQERVPHYVKALLEHLGSTNETKPEQDAEDDGLASVLEALAGALSQAWWDSAPDRKSRKVLFKAAGLLASARPVVAPDIDELLANDLQRALQESGAALDAVLDDLCDLAHGLSFPPLERLTEALRSLDLSPTPERAEGIDGNRVLTARALLARFARDYGADPRVAPFAIPIADVKEAIKAATVAGDAAVVAWVGLEPSAASVGTVLAAGGYRSSRPLRIALEGWGAAVTRQQRTKLLEHLLGPDRETSSLIAALARREFDALVLLRAIGPLIEDQRSNKDQRMRLAKQAAAIAPTTPGGQRALADLIVWLLDRNRKRWRAVDVEVAIAALHGLGNRHDSKRRLEASFNSAAPSATRKLTRGQIEDFHRAGLEVPQGMLKKSWRDRLLGR